MPNAESTQPRGESLGQDHRRPIPPEYLDTRQAAALLGVSAVTLEKWRAARIGPAYTSLPRCTRYAIEDLRAFMAAHRVEASARPVDPGERRGRPRKDGSRADASTGIIHSYETVASKLAKGRG